MGEDPVDDPVGRAIRDGEPVDPAAETIELPIRRDPLAQLEYRARAAEERLGEVLTAYRQLRAENEGYRDRVTRDVERQFDQRRERLVLKFIEILDNLDRALEAAERSFAGNPLIEGLILVRTQLLQILQKEGLERVPVLGLPYDPAVSEAVGTQPVSDREHEQMVVSEMLRGYRLHGRVVRASRVMVGAYQESAAVQARDAGELIGADEVRPQEKPATGALFDKAELDEMLGNTPLRKRE